ncbi:MAG TPA: biotin carboxylase N-terminal domain-containing protein [Roseiarcus sp.]|nr:biotin carboxylase N-terminal domain-containing protein [Roseiarcus sp.]
MFDSVLIANRGEIACRVIRTAKRLGVRTIAIYSAADRGAPFMRLADEAHEIGPAPARESYLNGEKIVALAKKIGAAAIHPGYGFLSENAEFAESCGAAGIVFIGPPPSAIRAMGLKSAAKALMQKAGVPVTPGYHGDNQSPKFLREKAYEIGYPVLIKAIAGGGGKGMRRVDAHVDFEAALESAAREAENAFGDARVLVEKYVARPRHIEMQIFGDAHGEVVHLFERDCSLQRRHQKVIEESPAPDLSEETRAAMAAAAVAAGRAVGYVGAGTVEFIADSSRGLRPDGFYFMEMNTRLQVEHPVTEAITGLDLVEWQFRVAAGETLPLSQKDIRRSGAAVEARLYAEDPEHGFLPSSGKIYALRLPAGQGIRVDSGVEESGEVTPFYDPMIAKIIAHGASRDEALDRLSRALGETLVAGPRVNAAFLKALCEAKEFRAGAFDTGFIDANLERLGAAPRALDAGAALAGLDRLLARRSARFAAADSPRDPWSVADFFELAGKRVVGVDALVDGKPVHFVETTANGTRRLALAGGASPDEPSPPTIIEAEGRVFALRDGRQTEVRLVDPLASGAEASAEESGAVEAPMHGRLLALYVKDGDVVEKGARLAIVEAMKMEHALNAPRAGRVAGIAHAPGAQVAQGARLMTIEEP